MTMARAQSNPVIERAIRAARLEDAVYDEVARDENATVQALMIVIATAILGGIGGLGGGAGALMAGLVFAPLLWVLSSGLAYFVGTQFMGAQGVTWIEVARALGFAQAPRVFAFLGIIPVLGTLVGLVLLVWGLATNVVALRASLRVTTGQAIITMVLSWLLATVIVTVLLGAIFGAALLAV